MNSRTTKNGQMKEINEKALRHGNFFCPFSWWFQNKLLSLRHRLLAHSWAAGGLIYEKDVFDRISI